MKNPVYENKNMGELVERLKRYPYGTEAHDEVKKALEKKILKKYPGQYVLCVPNKFVTRTSTSLQFQEIDTLSKKEGATSFDQLTGHVRVDKTFFESDVFKFVPREVAEYNFEYKQVNVFGIITDGTKFVLLKKRENDEITMIGGHTDYSVEAYNMNQLDYLRLNMQRELDEEVKHNGLLTVPEKPCALVNTYNGFHDLFHMAFFYIISVPNVDILFVNISSGENKHDIIKVDDVADIYRMEKLHPWFGTLEKFIWVNK